MDLRFILNSVDEPPVPANNNDTASEETTEIEDNGSPQANAPPKHHHYHHHHDHPPNTLHRLTPTDTNLHIGRVSVSPPRVPVPVPPHHTSPSTYVRQGDPAPPPFNIFASLLNQPELVLELAKALPLNTLINLYSISKPFHQHLNLRFTSVVLSLAHAHASESASTFIWRCYKSLCMRDPALRINEARRHTTGELRFIPSFKWLGMVLWREQVVDDILRLLAAEGHRLPRRSSLVLKKIWFVMDVSDSGRRVGLVHNEGFWANKDLFVATMFFLKLDMRFTCPLTGNGEVGMRKMILGMRSLSFLRGVLRREELRNQLDVLRMIVRFEGRPGMGEAAGQSVLGVPAEEVGMLQYEGWGAGGRGKKLIGISELVLREGIRRRLGLHRYYIDMMIYGYIDKKTFKDVPRVHLKAEAKDEESEDETEESEGEEGVSENETVDEGEVKDVKDEDEVMEDVPSDEISVRELAFRGAQRFDNGPDAANIV